MAIIVLIAIIIVIVGLYVWITNVQQGSLQSIELSLEPPAVRVGTDTYEIRAGQTASLTIIGTFSNGTTLDVSMEPDLTYCLSPSEELSLDETNNRVTGLLFSEEAIPLYVKISDITSNTIYIKVVLPTS